MPPTDSTPKLPWWRFALAICLTAYFLAFNWGTLRVHFATDDLSNIGHYYEYSFGQLVVSNFVPWRGDSRPFGAFFYIPIYHFAGLNPVPYQEVLLVILLANVYLVYRFAMVLGSGELPAWLVALAYCYHAGIANLYYNAAFIFDVLCCFFYLACFVFYLRIRNRGDLPGPWQTVVFLLLLLCALNSKEMAVSIPVMLLIHEWIYHRPSKLDVSTLTAWLWGPGRVALLGGLLTAVDIYGKMTGPAAMIQAESYHPIFSMERFLQFQSNLCQDLFLSWAWKPTLPQILAIWAVLAFLAWRRADRPLLRFLFWYLVIVALPIEFLPGKRSACFVLLMVGAAIFTAVVFVDVVTASARFLSQEFKLPPSGYRAVIGGAVAIAVILWAREQRDFRLFIGKDPMTTLGQENWDIVQQLRAIPFHPRPGSQLAFLDDPYHTLDMYFMARLWFDEPSVTVHVVSEGPLTAEQLAKMDYVFTVENRKIIRIR